MSEEPVKRIEVQVTDKKDDSNPEDYETIKSERDQLKQTLEDIAESEFSKTKEELKAKIPASLHDTVDGIESPFELEKFVQIYDVLKPTDKTVKSPTGVVSLFAPDKTTPLGSREFPDAESMMKAIYEDARKGDAYARQAKEQLWKLAMQSSGVSASKVVDTPKVKSIHNQYVKLGNYEVPVEDAKDFGAGRITAEEMKKRMDSGYYG